MLNPNDSYLLSSLISSFTYAQRVSELSPENSSCVHKHPWISCLLLLQPSSLAPLNVCPILQASDYSAAHPSLQESRATEPGFSFSCCSAVASGALGAAAAASSLLVCVCERWSHVLSPRPLFRCQFTWWAELLCIYLHCHRHSNWWGCLWHRCSKLWLFLSGLCNTIAADFTRSIKVCWCSSIGSRQLLHALKHISVIFVASLCLR